MNILDHLRLLASSVGLATPWRRDDVDNAGLADAAALASVDWDHDDGRVWPMIAGWIDAHPGGAFLDVGCGPGVNLVRALAASPSVLVAGFDANRDALHAAAALVQSDRALLVPALVGDTHDGPVGLRAVLARTDLPRVALDGLDLDATLAGRPVLIACDVEGAEGAVLRGGERLLATHRTTLLLAIHPDALAANRDSTDTLARWLADRHFTIRPFAGVSESLWWCEAG